VLVLPESARAELGRRPFGMYVHVPFCASRCGYCDFNTYTAGDLGGARLQSGYADAALDEVRLAARELSADGAGLPRVETVFFGGGTPTLLPPDELVRILAGIDAAFGLVPGAEVTVEANPDSVDRAGLDALRAGGFTRISFGMQSASSRVLAVLERSHRPGRPEQAAGDARAAGFTHVNLDLIFGTPGETDGEWRRTLDAALDAGPDHIAAYALTVEPRTRLAAQVRAGRVAAPDDTVQARRYALADALLEAAGFSWYELSNWARGPAARCRHNLLYWRNDHWWGVGPGAHSHIAGTRWWNIAHPSAYAEAVAADRLPCVGSETLTTEQRALEDLMLGVRLVEGLALDHLDPATVAALCADGLLDRAALGAGRAVLSAAGRPLADHVARVLATA
jgi:oxygen-independent coproporphyrinogen-3 oxidase